MCAPLAEAEALHAAGRRNEALEMVLSATLSADPSSASLSDASTQLLNFGRQKLCDSARCFDDIWEARACHLGCFRVVSVPNKGLGVYSSRAIEAGERLIAETPLLKLTPDGKGRFDGQYLRGERSHARSLLSTLSHEMNHKAADPLNRVIQTNGIQVLPNESEPDRDSVFSVVFLTISRLNHACETAANAEFRWNSRLQQGTVYALRDIPADVEILFNYGANQPSAIERRRFLREHFGFDCQCTACCNADGADGTAAAAIQPAAVEGCNTRIPLQSERDCEVGQL